MMLSHLMLVVAIAIAAPVQVTYLGNMGVLLEGGGKRVVIDALQRGELEGYAAVPPSLLGPLEQSRSPFETLDLLLTTHRHRDHFNAQSVAARIVSDAGAVYVAARETVDTLVAATTLQAHHPRIYGVTPAGGRSTTLTVRGTAVEVLDLPHNATRSRRVENVGFLFTLDGLRILHTGDADPSPEKFTTHRLAGRVDVAIVPFWYFEKENDAVRRAIGARTWIATHVPPNDTAGVRQRVQASEPRAIVLGTPGAKYLLP